MADRGKLGLIWDFLKVRKKWWLLPVVVFLLLKAKQCRHRLRWQRVAI